MLKHFVTFELFFDLFIPICFICNLHYEKLSVDFGLLSMFFELVVTYRLLVGLCLTSDVAHNDSSILSSECEGCFSKR